MGRAKSRAGGASPLRSMGAATAVWHVGPRRKSHRAPVCLQRLVAWFGVGCGAFAASGGVSPGAGPLPPVWNWDRLP